MTKRNLKYHSCFDKDQMPKKIALYKRLIAEILASVFFTFLIVIINQNTTLDEVKIPGVFFSILVFVFLSEGIFIFDSLIARKYPWHEALRKRVASLLVFALLWLGITGVLATLARPYFDINHKPGEQVDFVLGLTILVLFITIYVFALIASNYHKTLRFFILENEKLRQEKLKMDYFALQDQLNPHFLFNNLSTLMAIIPDNPQKALSFTENFTDVYRYVLKSSKHKLVTLRDEATFIQSYLGLHKERLGDGFSYAMETTEEDTSKLLPPLSLQYLVENAIKHNIATETRPLAISISTAGNRLMVSNNYQPKTSTYSTNTGLDNLRKRYEYLALKDQVEIINASDTFTVSIPLIDKNQGYGL
ncbi:sensor histidine kinase [Marinilabilia rubra]|uniref:Histidine kinase n=1 Tax=Marinilabilia rubra TaxID=2162893 RepID=A0A2U2B4I5_9BACT|nr:histidine kinase [Marinilabilia rubra]PWD97966.1 histidine kinase [Marinilabilia rubra]